MLVALALLVVVVIAAVLAGAVYLAMSGGAGRAIAALTTVVALAVLLVLVLAMGGFGGGGEDEPDDGPAPAEASSTPGPAPLQRPTIRLVATSPDALPPPPRAVGDLEPGTAVVVGVSGLDEGSSATVHQCPTGATESSDCRPGLPFTVGDDGRASVLVELDAGFPAGRGRAERRVSCRGTSCSLVVFGSSRLEVVTVFGPPPPPVTVRVEPFVVAPGGTLTATADGLVPGSTAAFAVCRPGGEATADCGTPTPSVRVGTDGRISAPLTISPGRCPRGATCAVAVVIGDGAPRALVPLVLTGRGGAGYEDGRLLVGLAVAGLLLALAIVLLVRTDWTPVGGDPFAGVELPEDPFGEASAL